MRFFHQRGAPWANDLVWRRLHVTGLSKFLGCLFSLAALSTSVQAGNVSLAWNAITSPLVRGYEIFYGEASGVYTSSLVAGSNLTATIAGLTPGVTYYFAVTAYDARGDEGMFSNQVTNRLPLPPSIIVQPLTQTAVVGLPVTLTVTAAGDTPLSFQWLNGIAPISGATASSLSWPQIASSNAGAYTVVVSNPWGSATSSVATLTVILAASPLILTQPKSQTVIATTAASFSSVVTGTAPLLFQWYDGRTAIAGATNSLLAWAHVANSNAGNYGFTVSNVAGVVTSSIATLTVIDPPSILTEPKSLTVIVTNAASISSVVTGTAPLLFQWYDGRTAIAGATNSLLAWAHVANSNAGNYGFTLSNVAGVVTSSIATLTVIDPPSILTQPQSQKVIATTAASFSSAAAGTAPLLFQWYDGTTAIAGATNSLLAWAGVAASNAGNYRFTVANAAGAVTSAIATLTVLPTNTIATVAGAYNGLFFQTNADGLPDITEATAGFLANCVVASNGAYSAKVYFGGLSYVLTGAFNISGTATATIPLSGPGSFNLTGVMQLDLFNGTQQMSGSISSAIAGNAWTAPLVADLATNAYPDLAGVNLVLSPASSADSTTNYGVASGLVVNSILSLTGLLGGTTAISQTVPISGSGNVPLYVNLYNNGGLLEGWINLTGGGGSVSGNLTWIYPGSGSTPSGGFTTAVQVTGSTTSK
jgi:hypothetical protein